MGAAVVSDYQLERQAAEGLVELMGEGARHFLGQEPMSPGIDFEVEWQGRTLVVEVKRASQSAAIRQALDKLENHRAQHPDHIPIVATLFMGPVGKQLCAERSVGWFDLSGNANIQAPGLRLLIEGKPNKFKRPGRASTAFAPKSSRIARWLLMSGDTRWTQQELTVKSGLDKGYVSRVLKRLRSDGLIRLQGERYTVDEPDLLLRSWQARYEFEKHRVIKGGMAVRTGDEAIRKIAEVVGAEGYAATGLAGAWSLDHFAMFRIATVYLREEPNEELFEALSFRPASKGSNVWLVRPNDEGVFDGSSQTDDGIVCAHWLQVLLDLAAHPERSKDAAEHLKQTHQTWRSRGA